MTKRPTTYDTVSALIETVETDRDVRSCARLAASMVEQALSALKNGDIAAFLCDIKLAGDFASRTEYGSYPSKR